MRTIVFDRNSRLKLLVQQAERQEGRAVPIRWHEFLEALSRENTGYGPTVWGIRHVYLGQAVLVSWQLSLETVTAALLRRNLIYLCWGIPVRSRWRNWLLSRVLRHAKHVLVNDVKTQLEVEALCNRRAKLVPFFVDTDFFKFSALSMRHDFLFCNGSNDRDPELLLGLARNGLKVVWLINDQALRARYEKAHPNLILRSNVPFDELRTLYQTCRATIMPALRDAHCAGQTTGMEAIACGAPLFISEGRTAGIFKGLPSVFVISGSTSEIWFRVLANFKYTGELQTHTGMSRAVLEKRVSTHELKRLFNPYLSRTFSKHAQRETGICRND